MSKEILDVDSFEPHDNPIKVSEVDELRQQLRESFTSGHGSLPPPPPIKRKKYGMPSRPNRGRHHRVFRILVIGLALTVVVASVIAFASYLAIQRRSDPPRNNNNVGSRPGTSFSSEPTISPSAPLRTTLSPTLSPVVTAPTPYISAPTLSPVVSAPTGPVPHPTPSSPFSPSTVAPPDPTTPGPTLSPTLSPIIEIKPAPPTTTTTRIPSIKETPSPTMNPTSTRAPTVRPVPIDSIEKPTLSPQVILPPVFLPPTRHTRSPNHHKRTHAPTSFQPVLSTPVTSTKQPQTAIQPPYEHIECTNTGDCDILSNFPYLLDFLCFDQELGKASECAKSCGLCGNATITTSSLHCVDDKSALFLVNDYWGYQSCKWLSMKPALVGELCQEGQDGSKHCPRLCGRCDACRDDAHASIFINYDIGYKTCSWLAEHPHHQARLCQPDAFGYKSCYKTCGRCSVVVKEYAQHSP